MVELDIIVLAVIAVLLLHAFNALVPIRRPSEFASEDIGDKHPVSTV